jgi:hypothetical protein
MILQENNLLNLEIDEQMYKFYGDKLVEIITDCKKCFDMVGDRIYYVTDSFNDAIMKAESKLQKLFDQEEVENSPLYTNCLIMHRGGFCMHVLHRSKDEIYTKVFVFSKKAMVGYGKIPHYPHTSHPDDWGMVSTIDYSQCRDKFRYIFKGYFMILLFIHNCEIETIVLRPNSKNKVNGVKFYNESGKSPINVLDCRWFREIIINTPFSVSGHLRWQRVGQGRTGKRLVWVEGFEKKGYHRKATKQKIDESA